MIPGMNAAMLMGGRATYRTASADFDGSSAYMTRGAGLTGAVDGKAGIISCWFRLDGSDATSMAFLNNATTLGGGTPRLFLYRNTANKIGFYAKDPTNSYVLDFTSNGTYTSGASWHHLLASWDLSASRFQLYVDDVADTATPTTLINSNINYTVADWGIGAQPSAANKLNGCLAEVYFNSVASLDLSVASNRRKFRSALGKPVSLGADGSRPTGAQPIIYQKIAASGAASDFATNLGSGGSFTITGALTLGSTSPSD